MASGEQAVQATTIRRRLTSMKRKGGERTRAKLAGKRVWIWSGQWGAWWRPEGQGYTGALAAAGVYTFEDAWRWASHCGPEKQIVFEVLPDAR